MSSSPPTYELIDDFSQDDVITVSPAVVLLVVRLGKPLSYSRKNGKSVTTDVSEGVRLRGASLVIVNDVTSITVTNSKDSHVETLQANLKQTDHNYLVEILPGDWMFAWFLDYKDEVPDLIEKIKNEEAVNDFHSGLKFVGRVASVRKVVSLNKDSGVKTSVCTVMAAGMKELDSSFFYSPLLAQVDESINRWLINFKSNMDEIFKITADGKQENNTSKLMRLFIQAMLGKGVDTSATSPAAKQYAKSDQAKKDGNSDALSGAAGGGVLSGGEQAPYAFLVPKFVGKLLGVEKSNEAARGEVISYADLLELQIGIQKYENAGAQDLGERFSPTLKELLGTYLPVYPNFTGTTLWNLLQQYLNPNINEMYTALKLNQKGRIVPHIVARQIPSTDACEIEVEGEGPREASGEPVMSGTLPVTRHLELPRWVLSPVMVENVDLGRSDATHFNFIHVYGQDANQQNGGANMTIQFTNNPPIRDDIDICRNGVRPYMQVVACNVADTYGKSPKTWMRLIADRLMGSQHTLNGTISSVGIQAPIAKGDTVEFDDVVYEIQSISHIFSQSAAGPNSFRTVLTLTNGYRADGGTSSSGGDRDGGTNEKFPIYPGFLLTDGTEFDPGIVVEDQFDRSELSPDDGDLQDDADNAMLYNAKKMASSNSGAASGANVGLGAEVSEPAGAATKGAFGGGGGK